jgi:hypothetical protein
VSKYHPLNILNKKCDNVNYILHKVLSVLGLENDIMEVAKDDKLGRRLQDAKLAGRLRALKVLKSEKIKTNPQVSKMVINGQSLKVGRLKETDGNKKY